MKKSFLLFLTLTLLLSIGIAACAAEPKIVDNAGLLTAQEAASLEAQASAISRQLQTDVVILTVAHTGGKDAQAYADDYYDQHAYGIGATRSGVLLLLDMDTCDWVISTCGDAIRQLSARDCDELFSYAAADLSAGNYYEGFRIYLSELEQYLAAPRGNSPGVGTRVLIAVGIGLLAGAIVLCVMIGSMRTARPKRSAADYLRRDTFQVPICQDLYLYSTTSRVKIESNSSSSHTHTSSSGTSHGGSRGKF